MTDISTVQLDTDILIVGGGAAGCMAAIEIKKLDPSIECVVMEKAHIERSGCLAMGLNAINAYLTFGETPETYVRYVKACPVQAIDLKLPSQIIKSGTSLGARCKKRHTIWEITNGNGVKEEFVIPAANKKESGSDKKY